MASLALRAVLETAANATNVGSIETSADLFNDRISLITATTLLGTLHGITTTLYSMTTYALLKKLFRRSTRSRTKAERRKALFYIVYTTILFVLVTAYTASSSQNTIVAYIDNRLYPGGPYQYYVTYMANQPVMIMTDVSALIILWMTDALIIFRFTMFYYQVPYARWIVPLPCAMFVGVTALSALVLQGEARLGKIYYLSEILILTYYTLSFSLNVLCAVLIAARLYYHKVQLERIFGPMTEAPYVSIATLLIESAALYATWSLLFLVLCVLHSQAQILFLGTMVQIQVIAPLLIILWIARGKTWNSGKSYVDSSDGGESSTSGSASVGRRTLGHAPSSRIARFAHVSAQLTRASSKLGAADGDSTRERRSRFWRAVVSGHTKAGSAGVGAGADDDNSGSGGGGGDVMELGLCSSNPSSITIDPMA